MNLEFQVAAWAVLALIALIVEITHRTFYLIIVCVACFLAMGSVLLFHANMAVQLGVVVLSSLIGVPIVGKFRPRPGSLHFPADQGQVVRVLAMRNGRLRVLYRGTEWDAIYPGPEPAPGQRLKIEEFEGNTLKLTNL